MRKLTTIPGLMILLFLVTAMGKVQTDRAKWFIAVGTLFVAVCMIIIKIPRPGKKQEKKGYILRG